MVLAQPFRGLRPVQWDAVDHLQPRSASFEDGLEAAVLDLASRRAERRLVQDVRPRTTALWVDDVHDGAPHRTAGLVLALRLDATGPDGVLPHERTFPEPVGRRVRTRNRLLAEPTPAMVLLRDQVPELTAFLGTVLDQDPDLEHQQDGTTHRARALDVPDEVLASLRGVPALVCDGHHRIAAARSPGAVDRDRILAWVVAAEAAPRLHPVHRTVRRLPPDAVDLLDRAGFSRTATDPTPGPDAPVLVTGDGAWRLAPERGGRVAGILAQLEPSVRSLPATLVHVALQEVLGIGTRRDEMGTTVDPQDATDAVASGQVEGAVLACGPTLDEVWQAAQQGVLLPAKATWFAPKPRAGAVLRPLPEAASR